MLLVKKCNASPVVLGKRKCILIASTPKVMCGPSSNDEAQFDPIPQALVEKGQLGSPHLRRINTEVTQITFVRRMTMSTRRKTSTFISADEQFASHCMDM